jgi:RNA polymerase sigma-70 factor, ECF subfamily
MCDARCISRERDVVCSAGPCAVQRAVHGDADCRKVVFDRLSQLLFTQTRRMTRSKEDAEDLLQESLLHAIEHLDQLRVQRRVVPWARRIVRNTWLMSSRRGVYEPATFDSLEAHHSDLRFASSPLDAIFAEETIRRILRHVPELTNSLRWTFELRVLEGRSTEETAALLGITRFAVRTRLRRARQTLRRLGGIN